MMLETPFENRYIKIDNINIRYWTMGTGDSIVLLLHGLGGTVGNWVNNVTVLAQMHCVYAIDFVGFGLSDKPNVPYSISYLADFLHKFMQALNIENANLVAHSMGGAVAINFISKFPDKIDKLVLVATGGISREASIILRMASVPIVGEAMTYPNRRVMTRVLRRSTHNPNLTTLEMVEETYQIARMPGARKALLKMLRSVGNYAGAHPHIVDATLDILPSIAMPTLVIWGKQDQVLPVHNAYIAVEKLPNSKLHIFDCCGHLPHFEHSQEFNTLILDHLGK